MSYKFLLTEDTCILNFSEEYPMSSVQLIESDAFKEILKSYINYSKKQKGEIYKFFIKCCNNDINKLLPDLLKIFKLLLIMDKDEISATYNVYEPYLSKPHIFLRMLEGIYLYWRKLQRYGIVINKHDLGGLEDETFISAQDRFTDLVLATYRQCEHSLGFKNLVYRQIIAGLNVALNLNIHNIKLPYEYAQLKDIPFIDRVTIHPPFITYSKSHKRAGLFEEVYNNPIEGKTFNKYDWFCYPAKVGNLIIFVYFNKCFFSQGVSLMNLFQMADQHEYMSKNPDLIYVCGYDDKQKNQIFYQDDKNDIMVGYLSNHDDFDYFGYMKKMILTLHNIKKINQGCLPIHGAMVEISFLDGSHKNIIVVGDSGAGKSETIEQIKTQGADIIDDIKIVYDDMGVLIKHKTRNIVSSGTEIGAFVRLNDLESGYGFKELDRAVFMNPDKINARIVVPTAQWNDVTWKYDIDYFMYANNYESKDELVSFFNDTNSALEVFKLGRRMTKGTTSESGISESFFANPFGPVQRKEQTEILLKQFFDDMFAQGVKIGQLYTHLGIEGMSQEGPKKAAKAFLKLIGPCSSIG